MEKILKKRRTFKSNQERVEATLLQNRNDQANKRKRDKEKKSLTNINLYNVPVRKAYQLGFNDLKDTEFTDFLTLTAKSSVFFGWWVKKAKDFTDKLLKLNVIGNFFKVIEYDGFEYHCHILIEVLKSDEFNNKVKDWKYGTTKVVPIIDYCSKIAHIEYCTKQLVCDSNNNKYQQLIDAWDMHLTPKPEIIIIDQAEETQQLVSSGVNITDIENGLPVLESNILYQLKDEIFGLDQGHDKISSIIQRVIYFVCMVTLQQINRWFKCIF